MSGDISRRRFLKGTAGAVATFAIARHGLGANEKLAHANIGAGGMGGGDRGNIKLHPKVQVVALCDVDSNSLARAAKEFPDARTYADWRELFAAEGDKIDTVNIGIPDHMHAAVTMTAVRAKKHVYCQKPLCHDVAECRAIAAATAAAGVVTQGGNQGGSGIGDRQVVHFLREGGIGKVRRLVFCSNRPGAIEAYRPEGPRPAKGEKPPAHLAWDLWLGAAPAREYVPGLYHPVRWRGWQDFGTSWMADIFAHLFDAYWKGLGLNAPKSVVAEVQKSWKDSAARRADTWPQSAHVTWTFGGSVRTEGPELPVEWFDGEFYPPEDVQKMAEGFEKYPSESAMVIGTEGALLQPMWSGAILLPREKFKGHPRPKLPPREHHFHFLDACLGGERTESHFVQIAPMTEAVLLGSVAMRVPNTVLRWDPAAMKVPNCPEANRFLRRTYRQGWEVQGLVPEKP